MPSSDITFFSYIFDGEPCDVVPFSVDEVHRALLLLDTKKPASSDNLEECVLKVAADYIAKPLTGIFNLKNVAVTLLHLTNTGLFPI